MILPSPITLNIEGIRKPITFQAGTRIPRGPEGNYQFVFNCRIQFGDKIATQGCVSVTGDELRELLQ